MILEGAKTDATIASQLNLERMRLENLKLQREINEMGQSPSLSNVFSQGLQTVGDNSILSVAGDSTPADISSFKRIFDVGKDMQVSQAPGDRHFLSFKEGSTPAQALSDFWTHQSKIKQKSVRIVKNQESKGFWMSYRIWGACLLSAICVAQEPLDTKSSDRSMHHQGTMQHLSKGDSLSSQMANLMHMPMMQEPFWEDKNLDLNFIANMIPHHKGAIFASEFLLQHSKDPNVRSLAEQIIKEQKAEIAEFEVLLSEIRDQKVQYTSQDIALYNDRAKLEMREMGEMMSSVELSGNLEEDYLRSMIPHHQGAIKASEQILQYTQNRKIRAIAHRIIEIQRREIDEFRAILQSSHK